MNSSCEIKVNSTNGLIEEEKIGQNCTMYISLIYGGRGIVEKKFDGIFFTPEYCLNGEKKGYQILLYIVWPCTRWRWSPCQGRGAAAGA